MMVANFIIRALKYHNSHDIADGGGGVLQKSIKILLLIQGKTHKNLLITQCTTLEAVVPLFVLSALHRSFASHQITPAAPLRVDSLFCTYSATCFFLWVCSWCVVLFCIQFPCIQQPTILALHHCIFVFHFLCTSQLASYFLLYSSSRVVLAVFSYLANFQ